MKDRRLSIEGQIRLARRFNKLTQLDLAARLGINNETLSRIERYKARPSIGLVEKLAEELSWTFVI